MWKVGIIFGDIMTKSKMKKVRNWPMQTLQDRRSVGLTPEEHRDLLNYDEKHGYVVACTNSGLAKSTYFNILNNGFARGSNIDKIRVMLKKKPAP